MSGRGVDIKVIGMEKVQRKLTPDIYLPSVQTLLKDAATFGKREAQGEAGRDIGAIAQTITANVSSLSASVGSRHPGALAAEFGRRAGTPPPPASALRAWAARHGMAGLEYALARAISRRGIKGRFFMRAAKEKLQRSELPRLIKRAQDEVERKWAQ